MGKLQGNDAACVAAALTQAEASLMGGIAAGQGARGKAPGALDSAQDYVKGMYEHYLDYVRNYDPDTGEGSVGRP